MLVPFDRDLVMGFVLCFCGSGLVLLVSSLGVFCGRGSEGACLLAGAGCVGKLLDLGGEMSDVRSDRLAKGHVSTCCGTRFISFTPLSLISTQSDAVFAWPRSRLAKAI